MSAEDEAELHRLCDHLRIVAKQLGNESPLTDTVKKAAFALGLAFMRGLRPTIEELVRKEGHALSEAEREHLRAMGIDPDAELL